MKYKIFTVPASHPDDATQSLNQFCASHKVTKVEKALVHNADESFWSFCVTYLDDKPAVSGSANKTSIDYREVLNVEDFAIYAQLRQLRKTISDEEGKPPYIIRKGSIGLTRRKKQRYQSRRAYWENQYQTGKIDALECQAALSSVQATIHLTNSLAWRQQNLRRYPALDL